MTQYTAAPGTCVHNTFTVERRIKAPVERVYAAFADPEAKERWFGGRQKQWVAEVREFDFRVGGKERVRGRWHTGMVSDFQATYHDIVPNERIVYAYDMYVDDKKLSVSVATIEVYADGDATRLLVTEQGVYFDSLDSAESREKGTQWLMDELMQTVEAD